MKPLEELDVRNPQHVDMLWTTMYELLADMDPRSRLMMTSSVMLRMMEKCFESVNPQDTMTSIHTTILNLVMSSYVKMRPKQKRRMISMCREILDEIEILCTAQIRDKSVDPGGIPQAKD